MESRKPRKMPTRNVAFSFTYGAARIEKLSLTFIFLSSLSGCRKSSFPRWEIRPTPNFPPATNRTSFSNTVRPFSSNSKAAALQVGGRKFLFFSLQHFVPGTIFKLAAAAALGLPSSPQSPLFLLFFMHPNDFRNNFHYSKTPPTTRLLRSR